MSLAIEKQRIEFFQREGLTFDVIDSGPLDGQIFVLLHGFPETNKSWTETAEILNEQGYRTFAINQRGYSLGAQPENRRDYRSAELVADVNALLEMIQQPVYLVGHDWGAVVAWEVAQHYPEKIKHLITVSVPHKAAFMRAMLSSNQLLKSYYIGLFQLPKIPELLFEKVPKLGLSLLKDSGMTTKQLEDFQQDMVAEQRLSYALNWYRGLPFSSNRHLTQPIRVPTLFIWGKHDSAVSAKSVELNHRYIAAPYREIIMDATHWIPVQNAKALSQYILETI
ncbi:alpha/beta fold hydrolase [Acinetobacter bereziniae]|uniref:alpha/beta fold hydrolase n=1 Tax=Acinetobacter bereziniae TaxID=106648 RepID=UPI001250CDDB|nr:alpha/beta fold hydrolase [Acinetobacter bereziniae]MBJ9904202.1 alpha/beta fold hydrolase [Acinetobacter bereziniae]MCU4320803.1 alpha/beta fold hydrolase [Acinetobacter bereziniae]MCU4599360.1 alpha/beta fold hydrolase [Acinetobacter bereziniae]